MRSDQQSCTNVAGLLAGYDENDSLPAGMKSHLERCLRCQAELAGYRRLRRSMLQLVAVDAPVDSGLEHRILFALDRIDDRSGRRLAKATAVTLGGLAAAAGVFVVASKQIRSLRMAG